MKAIRQIAVATLAVLAASTALWAITDEDFIKLADEVQRQHSVNQRMDTAVSAIDTMVDDLESNGLLREGNGEEMKRIAKVLTLLGQKHVPNAAKYLDAAKSRISDLKTNLKGAGGEIQTIIKELENLLNKATGQQNQNELLAELRLIIQKQEKHKKETVEYGRKMAQGDNPNLDANSELSPDQSKLSKEVEVFRGHVKDARDGATDAKEKARMETVFAALSGMEIEKNMVGAAKDIDDRKPILAMAQQDKALKDLKEIERLLMESDPLMKEQQDLKDLKEKLQELLKMEQELRQKTEQAPLPEQKKELQNQQHEIKKEAEKIEEKATPPEAKPKLEEAKAKMEEVKQELEKEQKQPAVEKEKKVEALLTSAIQDVEKRLEENEDKMKEKEEDPLEKKIRDEEKLIEEQKELEEKTDKSKPEELPNLEPQEKRITDKVKDQEKKDPTDEEMKKAEEETKKAEQDLHDKKKDDAKQHQEKAMEHLKRAVEEHKKELAKTEPEKKTEEDPKENERKFTAKKPANGEITDSDSKWSSMPDRQREALYQKYERDLPLEYKELLESYYKSLSNK